LAPMKCSVVGYLHEGFFDRQVEGADSGFVRDRFGQSLGSQRLDEILVSGGYLVVMLDDLLRRFELLDGDIGGGLPHQASSVAIRYQNHVGGLLSDGAKWPGELLMKLSLR